jgi:hypothetical protein
VFQDPGHERGTKRVDPVFRFGRGEDVFAGCSVGKRDVNVAAGSDFLGERFRGESGEEAVFSGD